ncbi:hypothetical protein DYB37_008284 [Aphanomyces astaci]|uniref:Uncharacterized protein n=1 Tax=Aphanomyces astaci TaxID=112090 RepID=A0A3R7AUE5_APHAT|nr:hypothetical protein DYB37_008284 [Aphanomyces astaci]
MKSLLPATPEGGGGRPSRGAMKSLSVIPSATAPRVSTALREPRHATITPLTKPPIKEKLTFLTNLKDVGVELRPPSPFDERAVEADYGPQLRPLMPENYHGTDALSRFWTMFQHHDTSFRSKRPRPGSPSHYEIGNELAAAMGESIALIPGIDSLNLASNRISDQAASDVIANLGASPTLGCLDMSNNMLNLHAATSLSAMITGSKTLVHINLEHNQLNNRAVTLLWMLALASMLAENAKVEELYLSWNKIRGLGAQRLVEALGYHTSLRVLDLSWNSLNSCPNNSVAAALATSLTNNKVLVHLDISNNALDSKACGILAAALVANHTVVGYVKSALHKHCAIKHFELHQDNQDPNTSLDAWWPYVDRACWLCGRWSEHRFVWTPSHKLDAKAKVKLHLSIDDWTGDEMNRSNDMFVLYRMLPPGKTKYFITVETEVDTDALVAKAYAVDLKHSKVDRIVRDVDRRRELEAAGAIHYRAITHLYRKYCARGVRVAVDQVSVSLSGFNDFLSDCRLIDESSERCKASDMDNVFVAANLEVTEEAKQQDNPDRSLTRFEFLECVFRIAINKYCNCKPIECESPALALHRIMDEHLMPMVPPDPNDFRTSYLYKEEISDCFLEYVVLNCTLPTVAITAALGNREVWRFKNSSNLCKETFHVLDDKLKQRDLRDLFFASKMLLLDEMAPPEVQKKLLYFTDFLELLLRVALARYPPSSPTVADAAIALQTLFVRHICAKEKLVETFQHSADKVRVLGAISRLERRPSKKGMLQHKASAKALQSPSDTPPA